MKNLILIKLGGSAITDKTKRKTAETEVINRLAREIAKVRKTTKDLFLISHGQGSFAHVPAKKFRTSEGNIAKNSAYGASLVQEECLKLNEIVLNSLIRAGIPALTFAPHSFLITNNRQQAKGCLDPIEIALNRGLVPVVYGDVIPDRKIGWTILSGEQILNILAVKLRGFKPKIIIEVGLTEGVYDQTGKTIKEISSKNYKQIKYLLKGSHGVDVTGGMALKVKEALNIAKKGIPTLLISAKPSNLKNALLDKTVTGTLIK